MSFARRLAASLSNHAVYLTEAGRADDLLALARRALDVLEQGRQRHPESVVEELPIAYATYAGALLDEERLAEAAEALEKASDAFTRCRSLGSGLRACATTANLIDVRERLADASGAAELRATTLRALDGLPPEEIAAIPGLAAQICDSATFCRFCSSRASRVARSSAASRSSSSVPVRALSLRVRSPATAGCASRRGGAFVCATAAVLAPSSAR